MQISRCLKIVSKLVCYENVRKYLRTGGGARSSAVEICPGAWPGVRPSAPGGNPIYKNFTNSSPLPLSMVVRQNSVVRPSLGFSQRTGSNQVIILFAAYLTQDWKAPCRLMWERSHRCLASVNHVSYNSDSGVARHACVHNMVLMLWGYPAALRKDLKSIPQKETQTWYCNMTGKPWWAYS